MDEFELINMSCFIMFYFTKKRLGDTFNPRIGYTIHRVNISIHSGMLKCLSEMQEITQFVVNVTRMSLFFLFQPPAKTVRKLVSDIKIPHSSNMNTFIEK